MKQYDINSLNEGQKLISFLKKILPNASSGFLYKMLRKKNIVLNDKKADGNEILKKSDEIKIYFSDETFLKFTGENVADESVTNHEKQSQEGLKANSDRQKQDRQKQDRQKQDRQKHNSIGQSLVEHNHGGQLKKHIIFENENFLVVNKPEGMLSQKAKKDDISLTEIICDYLAAKGEISAGFKPGVINRLDRNTTGIVLSGKNINALKNLNDLFKSRNVKKTYICLINGEMKKEILSEGMLEKNRNHNTVEVSLLSINGKPVGGVGPETGQTHAKASSETRQTGSDGSETKQNSKITAPVYIKTKFTPIDSVEYKGKKFSLLKVRLYTGKSHQIRAHLRAIGFSIVGDSKYGRRDEYNFSKKEFKIKNQFLHAYELEFPNDSEVPEEYRGRKFNANLSKLQKELLEKLKVRFEEI